MTAGIPDAGRHGCPDGVLVIDKPCGPTSHDVVNHVRRLSGIRRVGHAGTLDPFATGVLPLLIGRATRLARFLAADTKAYRATIALGAATTTDDLHGEVVPDSTGPVPPAAVISEALAKFRGRLEQRPPVYSAKKIQGTPAYALARRREAVTLLPVAVEVLRLDLEEAAGDRLVISLECSSGFYVRALARDLGEALGCGAHLTALRRTRCGEFGEERSIGLDVLQARPPASWPVIGLPDVVGWLPAADLTAGAAERVAHGNAVPAEAVVTWQTPAPNRGLCPGGVRNGREDLVRLMAPDGRLLAVGRRVGESSPGAGLLQPLVVLV